MTEFRGNADGKDLRVALVAAQFNEFLTKDLVASCLKGLESCAVVRDRVDTFWVPGSFEIPLIAQHAALSGSYDAIICLGVILKGETSHDKLLSESVSSGVEAAARETGVPMVFGVLSVDSVQQAIDRISGEAGNRGRQFAMTAVEMANLVHQMKERGPVWHKLFSKT